MTNRREIIAKHKRRHPTTGHLTDRERAVFVLRQRMPPREIAILLGLTRQQVKDFLKKARRKTKLGIPRKGA